MKELLLVGLGGAFGSLARYRLGRAFSEKSKGTFPWGTFFINISGALLLGLANSLGARGSVSLLFCDGFLGAYTTFSTFMYEGFSLFQENDKLNAFIYVAGTLLTGVLGYAAGYGLGRFIGLIH